MVGLLLYATLPKCMLTPTPILASKMLKSEQKISRFSLWMEGLFQRLENDYRGIVAKAVKYRLPAPVVIIAFVKGAEGTSFNRMTANMDIVEARLLPLVGKGVIKSFSTQAPAFVRSGISRAISQNVSS
ncbi:acriflavin resistance plasma membrane protein [Moritella sp. PE36]|nr:acriflavin resistance plasma membrane protein [Moritella sp. PE36]